MKAILKIKTITADTKRAKEVRLFGIPIFYRNDLNVQTNNCNVYDMENSKLSN